MARNKLKQPKRTISLRFLSSAVDKIVEAAKGKGMTVQDYFLSQVVFSPELSEIISNEQEKVIFKEEQIATAAIEFISGLTQLKEKNGLDDETFNVAIQKSFNELLKGKPNQDANQNQ